MITLDARLCTGCKVCVRICPHGVLALQDNRAALVAEQRCIECGACMLNCAARAIHVTKGTGCLVAIIKEDVLRIRPQGAG